MSMKLVRKFLQEDDDGASDDKNKKQSKKRRRKHRNNGDDEDAVVATEEDILRATVHSMMYLDRSMATQTGKTDSKNGAMKRIHDDSKRAKKSRKKLLENDIMVGNSRSTSSQMALLPSVPTFNKKRHKKEQEEKRLKEIAKLLALTKQKLKKNKKNKM